MNDQAFQHQVIERLARIEEQVRRLPKDVREMRWRIESLERWRSYLVGIAAAVGAGVGAVAGSVLTGGSTIGTLGGAAIGGLIGNGGAGGDGRHYRR